MAILISLLQGIFFALQKPWISYNLLAMCFAATTLLLAWKYLITNKVHFLGLALLLLSAQLIIFVVTLAGTEPPFSYRLLQVAIIVSYFSTVMMILLAGIRPLDPINAILLSLSVAMGIFLGESALGLLHSTNTNLELWPRWSGTIASHDRLGFVYSPYSVLKTYYPDNPRGYFLEEDIRKSKWRLEVQKGNAADLVFSSDKPEWLRVAIKNAETEIPWDVQFNQALLWHIQLNQDHLAVKSSHRYTVNFRARADNPRNIVVGFARAHDPWGNLGLFRSIKLTSGWQKFEIEFEAVADDDNARIHFDIGGSGSPVEFSDVLLRGLPDGKVIEPIVPKKYFVTYRFNALGCRGRDYTIPKPKGTTRILAIGDSYTMGVGVHEGDTFASQLERLLSEKAESLGSEKIYEVINCGVSGYDTQQERLFYELFGVRYEPNIVLLVMVWNDDLSFLEEEQRGYINRNPGKFERLFYIWNKIQEYRHQRRTFDFSKCVKEILQLDSEVRKQGAHLVVVIFRNHSDYSGSTDYGKIWNQLTDTVTKGLQGTDIPILDLGKALYEKHSDEDLMVHKVDGHPNEIAHKIAAQEILNFLQREGMLKFPVTLLDK